MTLIKAVSDLRKAAESNSVDEVVISLEILKTKTKNPDVHKKVDRFIEIANTIYEDFSEPLRLHHRKSIRVLCQYIEGAAKEKAQKITVNVGKSTLIGTQYNTHINTYQSTNIGTQIEKQIIRTGPTADERVSEIIDKVESLANTGNIVVARAAIDEGLQLDPTNLQLLFMRNIAFIGGGSYAALSLDEGAELENYCRQIYQLSPFHPGNTLMYVLFRRDFYTFKGMGEPAPPLSEIVRRLSKVNLSCKEVKWVIASSKVSSKTLREVGLK